MTPEQILASLEKVYAECPTYRDTGQVVTRFTYFDHKKPPRRVVKPFETAFVRPDLFRFEFRDRLWEGGEWSRYIISAQASHARTWWDVDPIMRLGSLDMALSAATGVSSGSAHTVPSLLMREPFGPTWLTRLREVTSLGDEVLDGATCSRLSTVFVPYPMDPAEEEMVQKEHKRVTGRPMERPTEAPQILWIDRETHLIRRIDYQTRWKAFQTDTTTTYEPAMGVPITDHDLRFDPPLRTVWSRVRDFLSRWLIRPLHR